MAEHYAFFWFRIVNIYAQLMNISSFGGQFEKFGRVVSKHYVQRHIAEPPCLKREN